MAQNLPPIEAIDYLRDNPDSLSQFNEHYGTEISPDALGVLQQQGDSTEFYNYFFGPREQYQTETARRQEAEQKDFGTEIDTTVGNIISELTTKNQEIEAIKQAEQLEEAKGGAGTSLFGMGLEMAGVKEGPESRAARRSGVDLDWGRSESGSRLQSIGAAVPSNSLNYSVPYILDREYQLQPGDHDYQLGKERYTGGVQFVNPITNRPTLFEDPTNLDVEDVLTGLKEEAVITAGMLPGFVFGGPMGSYGGMALTYGTYRGNQLANLYDEGVLDPKAYQDYVDVLQQAAIDTSWVVGGAVAFDTVLGIGRRMFAGRNIPDEDLRKLVTDAYDAYKRGDVGGPEGQGIFGPDPLTANVAAAYARDRATMLQNNDPVIMAEIEALRKTKFTQKGKDRAEQEFRDQVGRQVQLSEQMLTLQGAMRDAAKNDQFMKLFNAGGEVRRNLLQRLGESLGVSKDAVDTLLKHPIYQKDNTAARQSAGRQALSNIQEFLGGKELAQSKQALANREQAFKNWMSGIEAQAGPQRAGRTSLKEGLAAHEQYLDTTRATLENDVLPSLFPEGTSFDTTRLGVYLLDRRAEVEKAGGPLSRQKMQWIDNQLEALDSGNGSYESLMQFRKDYKLQQGQVANEPNIGQREYLTGLQREIDNVLTEGLDAIPDPTGQIGKVRNRMQTVQEDADGFRTRIVDRLYGQKGGKIKFTEDETLWKNLSKLDTDEIYLVRNLMAEEATKQGGIGPSRLGDVENALLAQYYEKVIKGNKNNPDRIAQQAEEFFNDLSPQGESNISLFNAFFGEEQTAALRRSVPEAVDSISLWRDGVKALEQKIARSPELKGISLSEPEKFFQQTWKGGDLTRTQRLFKILTNPDGTPVDPSVMENYRAYIARDLMDQAGVTGKAGQIEKDLLDPAKLDEYLNTYGEQLRVFFGDDFVTGLRNIQKAADLTNIGPSRIARGADAGLQGRNMEAEAKAFKDLVRAYVGMFTRAGRMFTAVTRIGGKFGTQELNQELLDMRGLAEQIRKLNRFDNPYVRQTTRNLGAVYAASGRHPIKDAVDSEPVYEGAEQNTRKEREVTPNWYWEELLLAFPLNEDDPTFEEYKAGSVRVQEPGADTKEMERQLRNEYNRFMNWRRGQRTRMKNDPTVDLPPRTTAPVQPQSSIDSSYFEPQKTPMSALASLPKPQAAPKQGGIGGLLPPSMREPGSTLAMAAQQRQPKMLADGGLATNDVTIHDYMAKDPYKDRTLTDYAGMRAEAAWLTGPFKHNTQTGGYGLRAGVENDATQHAKIYKEGASRIAARIPDVDTNMQGSLYDRSKNFLGGYDFARRELRKKGNTGDAPKMAELYQASDYLSGSGQLSDIPSWVPNWMIPPAYRGPRNEDTMADAVGDYYENLAGIKQAEEDYKSGISYYGMDDLDALVDKSMEWGSKNKRKRIEIGKGRR